MLAWKLALAVTALWVSIHFWLHPVLVRHWTAASLPVKMARAGMLAGLELLRDLCLRVALTLALALAVLLVVQALPALDPLVGPASIAAAAAATEFFKLIEAYLSPWLTVLGLVGAGAAFYYGVRHARAVLQARLEEKIAEVRNCLLESAGAHERFAPAEGAAAYRDAVQAFQLFSRANEQPDPAAANDDRQRALECYWRVEIYVRSIASQEFDPLAVLRTNPAPDKPAARPRLEKLARVLASRGLAQDLKLLKRSLSRVASAALVLSLLSWTAEPFSDSFRLAATQLRVSFEKQEAQRSLDAALSKAPSPPAQAGAGSDPDELAQTARQLSRLFVHRAVTQDFPLSLGMRPAEARRHAQAAIRAAILSAVPAQTGIQADALREDLAAEARNRKAEELATALERPTAEQVELLRERSPGRWRALVSELELRYTGEIPLWDAQAKLVSHAIGEAVGSFKPGVASEIARHGAKVSSEIGSEALATWVNAKLQRFIADVTLGSVESALAARGALNPIIDLPGDTRELFERLRAQAETVDARSRYIVTAFAAEEKSQREATELVERTRKEAALAAGERLPATEYARILERMRGGMPEGFEAHRYGSGGYRPSTPRVRPRKGIVTLAAAPAGQAAFADIRWSGGGDEPMLIELRLAGAREWSAAGRFPAGVVNQALRYAADGADLAVNLVNASPVASMAVHAHPALVDTALGCRLVELDRFVYKIAKASGAASPRREALSAQLREASFTPAQDLAWMQPSRDGLGHLEFWPENAGRDVKQASALLAQRLRAFAAEELGQDYEGFIRPVEQFVLLQRLFRGLLNGTDEWFPAGKLVALERETRKSVRPASTPRWVEPRSQALARPAMRGCPAI